MHALNETWNHAPHPWVHQWRCLCGAVVHLHSLDSNNNYHWSCENGGQWLQPRKA